jgi:hypothetical protein
VVSIINYRTADPHHSAVAIGSGGYARSTGRLLWDNGSATVHRNPSSVIATLHRMRQTCRVSRQHRLFGRSIRAWPPGGLLSIQNLIPLLRAGFARWLDAADAALDAGLFALRIEHD